MRTLVFGCKDTTLHVARWMNGAGIHPDLVTISPEKGRDQKVAGYVDLSEHAELFGTIRTIERYDLGHPEDRQAVIDARYDVGIAIGWQRLVPGPVLEGFSAGVFGMHGSARNLPYGRGRSPMNWSLIEGREHFHTNLFRYAAGVDDGPIVDSACFSIRAGDTAETMHYKNTLALINLLQRNWAKFESGTFRTRAQVDGVPTYYPKRSGGDGLVDWSDSIDNVERLIRAVSPPFPGAFSYLEGSRLGLNRAAIFYTDLEQHAFLDRTNGTVCDVFPNGKFLVRCDDGVLIVHEHVLEGRAPRPGDRLDSPESELPDFPRNRHGHFDR